MQGFFYASSRKVEPSFAALYFCIIKSLLILRAETANF